MKLQPVIISLIPLLLFCRGVLGGQIPSVNGVSGGIFSHPGIIGHQKLLKSTERTPGKLRGVVENSGICGWLLPSLSHYIYEMIFFLETTPGVYQASGYGDLTETESIWYSYFTLLRYLSISYRRRSPSGFGFLPHEKILKLPHLHYGSMVE
jgi:hypothetical protein